MGTTVKAGARDGFSYFAEKQEDETIKASIEGRGVKTEQTLASWDSVNTWIERQVTRILTSGRYETR